MSSSITITTFTIPALSSLSSSFFVILLLASSSLLLTITPAHGRMNRPSLLTKQTDFIPCSQSCDGGDVNHVLTASVRTMPLTIGDTTYTYRGRTYSTPERNHNGFMGPTIKVAPGQSLHIKLVNDLTSAYGPIGPNPPNATDYWKMLQNPGEHIKYQRYKKRVADPSLMKVDEPNMPHNFDHTNLHLHGLDVEVHMFDPVNTNNPLAPHIDVAPGQCYCYKFNVPEDHPEGMYWYHPHLHGSTAIQMWSGMIGLLYVEKDWDKDDSQVTDVTGDENEDKAVISNPSFKQSLLSYGVKNTQEFVIWDPAFKAVDKPTHNLEVDEFLLGQTTLSKIHPFLVNGVINPTFHTNVNEVIHLRALCATIENENTFIIYPEGNHHFHWETDEASVVPFWIVGSDGVIYAKPIQKKIMVMSGGQREEVLIKFDKPGRYVISQQGIQGMQFFDMRGHPHDQILATIVVEGNEDEEEEEGEQSEVVDSTIKHRSTETTDIADMRFTPGYKESESIKAEDIAGAQTIIFSMGANFDQAPFPQYYVNGHPFDPYEIPFHAQPGEAREYTLINANHNAHPFHIHVNRFQVKEMGSELSTDTYPVLKSLLDYHPDAWRDTVMVPPNGRTKVWVQFKNYTGKTVVHCHFLAHEDTGMMATLFIGKMDWVFRLEEHIQWIVGLLLGVLLSVSTFIYIRCRAGGEVDYSVVNMNELKAKAID